MPIVNATSAFSPLANSTNASSSAVTSALSTLCSSSSTCSATDVRGQLSSFYSSCTNELTGDSPNNDVIRIYDVLYTITPLKQAVCSKDDSGNYCVNQVSSSATSSISGAGSKSVSSTQQGVYELVQNNLFSYAEGSSFSKRGEDDENLAGLIPNTTTYRSSNLAFLFLNSEMSSDELCVSCTRSVLSAYISFEQTVPYALGIANSPMLGGQSDLYNAVTNTCGSSFLSGAVQAAGGLQDGIIGGKSSAPRLTAESGLFTIAGAAVVGLVAML